MGIIVTPPEIEEAVGVIGVRDPQHSMRSKTWGASWVDL